MKKILLILFIGAFTSVTAQNNDSPKDLYETAVTAFENKEYDKTIIILNNVKELLNGKSNPDITFLEAKSLYLIGNDKEKSKVLFEDFINQVNGLNDERENEAIDFIIELDTVDPTVSKFNDLKAKYLEKLGGADRVNSVNSIKKVYDLSIQGTNATYSELIENGKAYKKIIALSNGQELFKAVFNDNKGFIVDQTGNKRSLTDQEFNEFKEAAKIFPILDVTLNITSINETTYQGEKATEVQISSTKTEGGKSSYYFSEDYILLGFKAKIAEIDQEIIYGKYIKKDGLLIASGYTLKNYTMNAELIGTLREVIINPTIRQKDFE